MSEPTMGPVEHSPQLGQLAKALAEAQAKFTVAGKDKKAEVGKYSYAYADLEKVVDACRPHLNAVGVAVIQPASAEGARISVTTMLLHVSGEWMRATLAMQARDGSPQAVGSAITYARRYALASMVGVVAANEDDDGAEASRDWREHEQAPRRPQQQERRPPPNAPSAQDIEAIEAEIGLAKDRIELQEKCLPMVRKIADNNADHKLRVAFNKRWKELPPVEQQRGAA